MPPGPGARRAILVSTVSVLAGGGAALLGSLVLRIVMARALDPGALGLVLLGIAIVTPIGSMAGLGTNATEIECAITVLHTWAADLDITLQSPAGTIVQLTTDNGAGPRAA